MIYNYTMLQKVINYESPKGGLVCDGRSLTMSHQLIHHRMLNPRILPGPTAKSMKRADKSKIVHLVHLIHLNTDTMELVCLISIFITFEVS